MPGPNLISPDRLLKLIGLPQAPVLIDVRPPDEVSALPLRIPASVPRVVGDLESWAPAFAGRGLVVVGTRGGTRAAGCAALLREAGQSAELLEGGIVAWQEAGQPLVAEAALPARDAGGRTNWVTRSRPKVDRIACPWLIRRFVDPFARILFVAPSEVPGVAADLAAAPFDIEGEGMTWSHSGPLCTFDTMVQGFGLSGFAGLAQLAPIVRGADTGHPELAPESAGLLAASLGLSRMFADDHEQLEAGILLYDSFYRWCRDARDETHDWASHTPSGRRGRQL
ncbi:MAG: sulfurtransferase [Sphingomonas sp.]|nr:MAG: sulfurtransferase [Sphingomonas sp.]